MGSLVVLLAPEGSMQGVGDALTDWSAADLLHPYCWVDAASWAPAEGGRTPSRGRTPALLVRSGRLSGTTLEQTMTAERFDRVRLVVLVPAIAGEPGVPAEVEHAVHQAVLNTTAGVAVDLLRAVVTRPDSGPVAADLVREGWHNLLVAPEESRGPGLGQSVLPAATEGTVIGPDAAATVASVSGLWQSLDAGPLDGQTAPFGQSLRLVRSYYRGLDATAVTDQVRHNLLSLEDGVPLPRQHGSQAIYIDNAPMAANDMASSVLRRHAGLFRGERVAPAKVDAERIGAGQALKMLFGFLWASLTMAPMKWYSMVAGDVGSAARNWVQKAVFGADQSAYDVVAKGELVHGGANWRDLGRASASLEGAIDGKRTHEYAGDFSSVWSDYVESGLTLLDAGDRGQNTPIQVGTERGVLRQTSDCVPAPDEAFDQIPPRLAQAVGMSEVRAADPLGQHTLHQRLRSLVSQPMLARDADSTVRQLETWQQRHKDSYAARTGAMLSEQLMATSEEVKGLFARLSAGPQEQHGGDQVRSRQKLIATWMQVLFALFVVLLGAMTVLAYKEFITWKSAGMTMGAGFLVWFISSLALFLIGQRELFQDLNRRSSARSQQEADQQNLRTALRDLHRQTEAYGQFLEWTRVLGVVLHSPFGPARAEHRQREQMSSGLPMGVRTGGAEVDQQATGEVVATMRRDLFQTGWLSGPWQATLNDAGRRLGNQGTDLTSDPRRMFAQRAQVSESLLTAWADRLEQEGMSQISGDQLWSFALERLSQPDLRNRLVSQVVTTGQGVQQRLGEEDFMAGVDGREPQQPGRFDDGVLVREARLEGRADAVVQSWPVARTDGLSCQAVLVQLGDPVPDYTFDLGERISPAASSAQGADGPQWNDPATGRPPSEGLPGTGMVF